MRFDEPSACRVCASPSPAYILRVAMPPRLEGDHGASVPPGSKPWGASTSYGRGAVKPPLHARMGTTTRAKENYPYAHVRSRVSTSSKPTTVPTFIPPAGSAVKQQVKKSRNQSPAPAPTPAPASGSFPPTPSATMLKGAGGCEIRESDDIDDDVPLALAPFKSDDYANAIESAHIQSNSANALSTPGCTLHDLAPEDKRKVAKLIKQVVEYADSKKKMESELDATTVKLSQCEQVRDKAIKAEETRKQEIQMLTKKLDQTLAKIDEYKRKEKGQSSIADDACRFDSTSFGNERKESEEPKYSVSPDSALWAMSPMTRAVVDEVRAVLAGDGTGDVSCDANNQNQSPAERQRPPLAVAPTNASTSTQNVPGLSPVSSSQLRWLQRAQENQNNSVYAPPSTTKQSSSQSEVPEKGLTKANRMRAAANVAAMAAASAFSARHDTNTNPLTPTLPDEVRAAAHAAAASASPEHALVAALAAGAAAMKAAHGEGNNRWTLPLSPSGKSLTGNDQSTVSNSHGQPDRVLRFDPEQGNAGAFYFGERSFHSGPGSEGSGGGSTVSDGAALDFQRSVRAALGVPEVDVGSTQTSRHTHAPVSLHTVTKALVGLDDDMTEYGAKVTHAAVPAPWWESERLSDRAPSETHFPDVSFSTVVPSASPGGSEQWVLQSGGPPMGEHGKRADVCPSAFGPVLRGPRLATIATRIARDDEFWENPLTPPKSPMVPKPPHSLVVAARNAVIEEVEEVSTSHGTHHRVPSRFVTTPEPRRRCEQKSKPKRTPDPAAMTRAHAAVKAAAAAVDAALQGTVTQSDPMHNNDTYAYVIPVVEPVTPTVVETIDEEPPEETPREESPEALSPETEVTEEEVTRTAAAAEAVGDLTEPEVSSTVETCTPEQALRRQPEYKHRSIDFDWDLIDLVDEVDEISLLPEKRDKEYGAQQRYSQSNPTETSYTHDYLDRWGLRVRHGMHPRAAAAASARRVASRSKTKPSGPDRARRRRLTEELSTLRMQRSQKAEEAWHTDYRSFSESIRGNALM